MALPSQEAHKFLVKLPTPRLPGQVHVVSKADLPVGPATSATSRWEASTTPLPSGYITSIRSLPPFAIVHKSARLRIVVCPVQICTDTTQLNLPRPAHRPGATQIMQSAVPVLSTKVHV